MGEGRGMSRGLESQVSAREVGADEVLDFRECHRLEMNSQIVHDSIHTRRGWSVTYLLENGGKRAGFASVAVGGPWKDKPTFYELFIAPEERGSAFALFEAFLA